MRVILLCITVFLCTCARAQIGNDVCSGALPLPGEMQYCSGPDAFTTRNAALETDLPDCFTGKDDPRDVWFSFTALTASVSISVNGNVPTAVRGSATAPQLALYPENCDAEALACRAPATIRGEALNTATLIYDGLMRGERYNIRVEAGGGGTFELCVNQYEPGPPPGQDCANGVVLCDKEPFTVSFLRGRGDELDSLFNEDIDCRDSRVIETNSAWYKWTCEEAGTLDMTLTPLGGPTNEDIDFVIYALRDGTDDCSGRRPLRQMYSSREVQNSAEENLPCLGATGLRPGDTDELEACGCDPGNDNFVRSLDMEAGASYALVVLNNTRSGDGFRLEFGGTGTFAGPQPSIGLNRDTTCIDEPVTFTNQTRGADAVSRYEWDFGPTASPRYMEGAGPHAVSFSEAGRPRITLGVSSERGCITYTNSIELEVVCCEVPFEVEEMVTDVSCPNAANGRIALSITGDEDPDEVSYAWSNGDSTAVVDSLAPGNYSVLVTGGSGCEVSERYTIIGPPAYEIDTVVRDVNCYGDRNGAVGVTLLDGGAGNYRYSFEGGAFGTQNRWINLGPGTYNVVARDADNCEVNFDLAIREPERLEIALRTDSVSCFGQTDGALFADVRGGTPDYIFTWADGAEVDSNRLNVAAGNYALQVTDANGCASDISLASVGSPPELTLSLTAREDLTCVGDTDGFFQLVAEGGQPGYTFSSDGDRFQESGLLDSLPVGSYDLLVRDAGGCLDTLRDTIRDPIAFTLSTQAALVLDLGSDTILSVSSNAEPVTYEWGPDSLECLTPNCAAVRVAPLESREYSVVGVSPLGCLDSAVVKVAVINRAPVFIPNVLLIGGREANSRFTVYGGGGVEFVRSLRVYDRWGAEVFAIEEPFPAGVPDFGWDGRVGERAVATGTYVYVVEVAYLNGTTDIFRGSLTVLRR